MKLCPRSRKDLCLIESNSSKRGCKGLSVIVFHNLQSRFPTTSVITCKFFCIIKPKGTFKKFVNTIKILALKGSNPMFRLCTCRFFSLSVKDMQWYGCYLHIHHVCHLLLGRTSPSVFFLAIENTRFRQHEEFDRHRRPQQRILGSLTIKYLRKTESRPPPTDVLPENFQLCKW